ncbi:MAG: hypothetical protein L0H64_13460 [Pseudonocardia sp.]|nr:hypothetical protein [Pseudonocardia sp.]
MEARPGAGGATVLLLAPVTDPAAIPHALAAALDLQVVHGDVLAACTAVLRTEPRLLVVDNCEHLIDAAERVSRLAPLPVPIIESGDDGQHLTDVPSVAIFLDRASRVRPDLAPGPAELRLVADIVRRLDGMPLAIELAAGRLSTLSLPDLHERLDRSLDLLGGGRVSVDARHRTLRATVEWSYQLLSDDERTLFRNLAVFVDGVDLGTAEEVAAGLGLAEDPGSLLVRLVDASMIDAVFEDVAAPPAGGGRTRYRMLGVVLPACGCGRRARPRRLRRGRRALPARRAGRPASPPRIPRDRVTGDHLRRGSRHGAHAARPGRPRRGGVAQHPRVGRVLRRRDRERGGPGSTGRGVLRPGDRAGPHLGRHLPARRGDAVAEPVAIQRSTERRDRGGDPEPGRRSGRSCAHPATPAGTCGSSTRRWARRWAAGPSRARPGQRRVRRRSPGRPAGDGGPRPGR